MKEARVTSEAKIQSNEIDLVDFIKIVYCGKKIVVLLTIFGLLFGGALGYFFDKKSKKTYIASIEFMYMPKKIKSSEELKIYAFDVYLLNSLSKKDGLMPENGGYETPTIILGDNAVRFNRNDRYSYRVYVKGIDEKSVIQGAKSYYSKFLEEATLLGYSKEKFYKLSDKFEGIEPKRKQIKFLILGAVFGIFFGIMVIFSKEVWIYFRNELKNNI